MIFLEHPSFWVQFTSSHKIPQREELGMQYESWKSRKKTTARQGGVRRKCNFLIFATPWDRKLGACVWQRKISINESVLFTLACMRFSPEARMVAPLELQVCSHMYMSQPALLLTCSCFFPFYPTFSSSTGRHSPSSGWLLPCSFPAVFSPIKPEYSIHVYTHCHIVLHTHTKLTSTLHWIDFLVSALLSWGQGPESCLWGVFALLLHWERLLFHLLVSVSCNDLPRWVLLVCALLQSHQSCVTACLLLPGQSTALHTHLEHEFHLPLDGTVASLRIPTCKRWHFPPATPTCPYQTTWFTQHHLQAKDCFQKDSFLLFEIDVQKNNTTNGQMEYKPCIFASEDI